MTVLTLDEIKTHLRIELDDASRDAELARFEAQALDYAEQYIGRTIPWLDDVGDPVAVPASVKGAMLLLIGDYDQMRENTVIGVSVSSTDAAERQLHFYRIGMGI